MKDYYYILGVARTSSGEEIRKAYRKLSLKFHPDKNDGDKFFEDRFKEINEAYETLSDPIRRFNYDEVFVSKTNTQQATSWATQTSSRNNPPRIISFTTDKPHIRAGDTNRLKKPVIAIGDTITFNWEVENATSVELSPFGMVPTTGVKVIKVMGFNLETGLEVELKAYNSSTNETDERRILFPKRTVGTSNTNFKESNSRQKKRINKQGIIFIAIMVFITSVVWLNDRSNPEIHKRDIPSTTVIGDSETTMATDSILITGSDFTTSNTINPPEHISQWKGNHLKNGDSPFKTCFGKGKRGGRSWILFQNRNGVDAIVCLTNSTSGVTIRNEYVQAGASFKMSNVPDGTYYVKALYGNDWNPHLTSPCGSKGFFESNVSFSVSDGYSDAINVETSNDGYSIHYSTHTITLYPVANGNMSQRGIDANQFFEH